MPRPATTVPKFCVDKSGRAFTKVKGRFFSLGRADSPESKARYSKLLEDFAAGALTQVARKPQERSIRSVSELLLLYATTELPRYSRSERGCSAPVMRLLRELFGESPVNEFGPLRLRIVRDAMVAGDASAKDANGAIAPRKPWSRKTVNKQIKRLRAIFRWGVSLEIVPESVAAALATLRPLSPGETAAVDYAPRRAVPLADLQSVRNVLRPFHQDIFDLLLLTGARLGEVLGLRMKDIDRTGDVWRAELARHKTAAKGKSRTLYFNSAAQQILLRHFQADPESRLFPMRRDNYSALMQRACKRAGVVPFVAHQLRHTVATRLADEMGTEAAQRLLGHAGAAMTEHYSRAAERLAIDAVKRLG